MSIVDSLDSALAKVPRSSSRIFWGVDESASLLLLLFLFLSNFSDFSSSVGSGTFCTLEVRDVLRIDVSVEFRFCFASRRVW